MSALLEWFRGLPPEGRVAVFLGLAVAVHFGVKALRLLGRRLMTPPAATAQSSEALFKRHYPKLATVTSLIVSTVAFAAYFIMVGLALGELNVDLRAYLATATVIGLAVGFGSQGLVQDVVIGLTLLFSDALHIGDVVEVSGQIGKVEEVGLRFTRLVNFAGQDVYVPNRNIGTVGRFRDGSVRAYVNVQLPAQADPAHVRQMAADLAMGMRKQYPSIILDDPRLHDLQAVDPGGWEFFRVRFRIWPGQNALIETVYRQRLLAALRALDPGYADWMLTVVFRVR